MAQMDNGKIDAELKRMYHDTVKENSNISTGEPDARDMYRMGKAQQFKRIFPLSSMIMFTSMVQGTWEAVLVANFGGMTNGGLAGLFWGYIWTFLGFSAIVMSLAEMASMAPTSGGQYHWVSEFAPRKYQKFLSYISGWMSTLSWQAGTAGASFILGVLIQAVVVAYNPSYIPKRWQGTLFVFLAALIQGLVNIGLARQLPRIQKIMVIPHGLGWIAVVIVLWALAPHASTKDVFTSFTSNGGWEPIGLSLMVGQITSVYFLILSDSAAHLSEEVKTAATTVPRAMIWSFCLNALVGFIVLITFLFAVPDIATTLDPEQNPSGFAFLYVFQQASYKGSIVLTTMIILVIVAGIIDSNCSTSRQVFAFARDGGLPFRKWLSKVHDETVPRNAVILTCIITILLSLINLGSTVAFNAIISLQLLSLMSTYCISIGCVFYQRITGGRDLPPAQWSLGRYGIWINGIGFVYSAFILFWAGWPGFKDVDATTFNWSSVMFVAIFIFALGYYVVTGRKTYDGPVVLVRRIED